jgi:alkylhydroperoxidase family enzyme
MPRIPLSEELVGIRGLLAFKPSSGVKVARLIDQLLRGDSELSAADRERIAAHVSQLNECEFCARSHAATIPHLDAQIATTATTAVGSRPAPTPRPAPSLAPSPSPSPSPRLAALLDLAGEVTRGGHFVTSETVGRARAAGASDEDIHDTVLIAAAFCMLNRYLDGLGAITPTDDAAYDAMGVYLAGHGYLGAAPAVD